MGFIINKIKEEINSFINEFYGDDEPSIADDWYSKKLGINTKKDEKFDGEFVGLIGKNFYGERLKTPTKVFRNPKTLRGFERDCRGILLQNGDFYLMSGENMILHDVLLNFLINKKILPSNISINYPKDYPNEYISVEREGKSNIFLPTYLYDSFPSYYQKIFEIANSKNKNYKFYKNLKRGGEVKEQLDMNRAYSYQPRDLDPNRNFGRPF